MVHEANFFLNEGLGVLHSGEQAIEAGHRFHAGTNFLFRHKELRALGLLRVLGFVGQQRLESPFEVIGDVDDEGWADVGIEGGVEDLEGANWGLSPVSSWSSACRVMAQRLFVYGIQVEFLEAGEKAGFVTEMAMLWRDRDGGLPSREDDNLRAHHADHASDLETILGEFSTWVSGISSAPRQETLSILAASAASFARSSAVPRVPISPRVRSRMAVR